MMTRGKEISKRRSPARTGNAILIDAHICVPPSEREEERKKRRSRCQLKAQKTHGKKEKYVGYEALEASQPIHQITEIWVIDAQHRKIQEKKQKNPMIKALFSSCLLYFAIQAHRRTRV
jgi:hypothetical protein